MSVKAGQIEKGMYILYKNNEPFLVTDREFVNPGKGAAFVRCKLKGLISGQVLRETIKSHDSVEPADVENSKGQYMYKDAQCFYFMNEETFDQYTLDIKDLKEHENYLREGESYQVIFFNGNAVDIVLPSKVVLTVTVASEAIKGDTSTGVTKTVECDTGLQVKVPGFIKEGEKILVNTETGEYAERVNS